MSAQMELFTPRRMSETGAVAFDPYPPRADDDVSARLEAVALQVARERGRVTADDLHGVDLGARDGRIIGAVLRKLSKAGLLVTGPLVLSQRRECHHRPIREFHAPRAAASARTADHGGADFDNARLDRPDGAKETT